MPKRYDGPTLFRRSDGQWIIKYKDASGRWKQRRTGTSDSVEAKEVWARFIIEQPRPRSGPAAPEEMTVATAMEIYLVEHGPQVGDQKRLGICAEQVIGYFGKKTVAEINPALCKAFVRESGRSDQTDRRVLSTLQAAINHCWNNRHLTQPVPVWLPKLGRPRTDWLTRSEVARILRASRRNRAWSRQHLPMVILIAVYTGRRIGAITDLQWGRVDLDGGWIDFDIPGRKVTNKRRGRCRIHPKLMGHLRRHAKRFPTDGREFRHVIEYAGKPVRDVRESLARACRFAEVRRITPHIFRHTCVSWLMQWGVPTANIGEFVGMTEKQVSNTYGHLDPNFQDKVLEAFSRFGARHGAG